MEPTTVRFGGFEVDLASGELRRHGIRIHLREQSFQSLALMLERPGQVVTREDLRRRLWPGDVFVDFENNLNNAIARLRQALGDSAERPRFIETLPKRGYRFIGRLEAPPGTAAPAPSRVRLVVLPFATFGDIEEDFGVVMTEEVTAALAALAPDRLGVIARTTAMRYRETTKSVDQIRRELNVDFVVEGGVRREDGHLLITVQLVRADDQTHLLARRYRADPHDVFELRGAIAEAISEPIGVLPSADRRAPRRPTQDLEAYTLYVRARSRLAKELPEGFVMARQFLEMAVARDPAFALAYDALAELHWYLGFWGVLPQKDVNASAMFYAIKALDHDPTLPETHALLGVLRKDLDFNWSDVKREMDRARELDAVSPLVRLRYAVAWLLPQARLEESAAEIELALESDPQSVFLRSWFAAVLWLDRRYDRALLQGGLIVDLAPAAFLGHFTLGLVLREQGRFEEAIAEHRKAVELSGDLPLMLGWLGLALGQAGRTAEARATLDRLSTMATAAYVPPTSFAWTCCGLGDLDQALVWMDRAIDARDHMIMPILSYPFLDPVREDPRFLALLRKLNLEPARAGARPRVASPVQH